MTVIDTYTIQIVRAEDAPTRIFPPALDDAINEAEENLTDLLPQGYRAVIRRWDQGDEDA